MPNLPISGLTGGNPAQSSDLIPIARSGVTYNVTAGSIADLAGVTTLGLTQPSWWNSGDGSSYSSVTTATGLWGTGTANQVKVWLVRLPYAITVRRITLRTNGSLAASHSSLACYDVTGNTKLFAFENFATTSSGVTFTTVLSPTVTLPAGMYYMACACDSTGTAPTTLGGFAATGTNEGVEPYNTQGTVRSGTAANAMGASGVMPATLGALSPGGGGLTVLPLWTMEP